MFAEINARPEFQFTVTVSYMELYNERIFDLLDDKDGLMVSGASPTKKSKGAAPAKQAKKDYAIVEDTKGGNGTYVRGLLKIVGPLPTITPCWCCRAFLRYTSAPPARGIRGRRPSPAVRG